jgi:Notch-like protein
MTFGHSKHQEKFARYYGVEDYADQWIRSAVNGTETEFVRGNADFVYYDVRSREDVMLAAPKVLNVWMYVVRMMEYAVARCGVPCGREGADRCDDVPVRAWDQAVGFYAGSLEGPDGEGNGVLLYDLADTMCINFKTCMENGNHDHGTSSVNLRVMDLFGRGQLAVLRRECSKANDVKDHIVRLMSIPLIQATLYSSHIRNFTNSFEEVKGATYAASILPIVHDCNQDDAFAIYSNLGLGQSDSTVDTMAVKQAFENNFACMGVTCEDIGGVWEGKYYGQYSLPCNFPGQSDDNNLLLVAVIVGFVLVPCMLLGAFLSCRKKFRAVTNVPIYEDSNEADLAESPMATIILD